MPEKLAQPGPEVPCGVVVADKPAGWTSHQVVGRARRLLGTRKIGHAGTLDPMATGVLVLGVGRATRLLGQLALTDKAYEATIRLGQRTNTDDADGEIIGEAGAAGLTDAQIKDAIAALTGRIQQVPSAVSAIKVGGVRSYARVRAGEEVTLAARSVLVSEFTVLARHDRLAASSAGRSAEAHQLSLGGHQRAYGQLPVVDLEVAVECSSGTYIRALARDLGAALGTGGHLTALCRTRVGPFTLDQAQDLTGREVIGRGLAVTSLDEIARNCFPSLDLTADQARQVRFGRPLPGVSLPGTPTAVFDPDGSFLALYRPAADAAVPQAVFVG